MTESSCMEVDEWLCSRMFTQETIRFLIAHGNIWFECAVLHKFSEIPDVPPPMALIPPPVPPGTPSMDELVQQSQWNLQQQEQHLHSLRQVLTAQIIHS